ncbi:MAG: Wzz/FepE/Etk N-terminal domain-containing protein [Collinsella sp.]|nr:Wzz/FepE/Etk N-terminal domain-containing protein [Collinsella sp.]
MTLLELLQLLKKRIKLVVVLPVVCALVMGGASFLLMKNTYTARTSMYILARNPNQSAGANYSDLNASQLLANDVATLLKSDAVVNGAARNLGLESLDGFDVSVANESTSRVITLSVTGTDPEETARVANAIASEVATVAQDVEMAESINVIDSAKAPEAPSGPKRPLYVAVAFMGGLFAAVAIVVIMDMLNTRVRNSDDAEELLGVPVIGRIPAMKGGK